MNQQGIDKPKVWCEKCQNHHEVFKSGNHTISEMFDWIWDNMSEETKAAWGRIGKILNRMEIELLRKEISKDGYRL